MSSRVRKNHLLEALPAAIRKRLEADLESIQLELGQVLYEPGSQMSHVYFPLDSIVSLLYITENGAPATLAAVGNEGVVGIALFMGGESTLSHAVVCSRGRAVRLPAERLKTEFRRHGQLHVVMLRYTQFLITQMAQTAVCNRHHSIEEQLSRWLLVCLDRVSGNALAMTHELIAQTLGVRREGVSAAANRLQKAGAIAYRRGQITVLDRNALEHSSCECYAVVRDEMRRLQSYPAAKDRAATSASM